MPPAGLFQREFGFAEQPLFQAEACEVGPNLHGEASWHSGGQQHLGAAIGGFGLQDVTGVLFKQREAVPELDLDFDGKRDDGRGLWQVLFCFGELAEFAERSGKVDLIGDVLRGATRLREGASKVLFGEGDMPLFKELFAFQSWRWITDRCQCKEGPKSHVPVCGLLRSGPRATDG